jgi:integrase
MINNQILKTMKGLKTFTIEDVELITDCSETEILNVIENLNLPDRKGIYFFEKIKQDTAPRKTGVVGKNIFLKTFAQRFLETLNCGDTTKRSYEIYLKLHILPYLGSKRIIDIYYTDIDNFRNKKIGEGCSNKNINNFINLLNRIFEFAIDQNLINKNPCRDIERLKTESKKKDLSEFQINNLLKIVKTEDYSFYVMLLTAVETGLLRGQVLNLTWKDADFENKKICGIKVSDKLMTVLNQWQKICPVYSSNLVFPNKNGNKICGDNMIKRKFKPLCKRAGIEDLRFIDLRVNSIK